jgi:type I restriction enzyme S subunit
MEVVGSTIPTISESKILNFKIVLPPNDEMKKIVAHLATATQKIARAIQLKEQEIEKLKEYRSVLINSAVTGKIKIA